VICLLHPLQLVVKVAISQNVPGGATPLIATLIMRAAIRSRRMMKG
jgi:hypothetical protein